MEIKFYVYYLFSTFCYYRSYIVFYETFALYITEFKFAQTFAAESSVKFETIATSQLKTIFMVGPTPLGQ